MIGKKTSVKKMFFWLTARHGTLNDSDHIGLLFSDKKYRSVMGGLALTVCAALWMLLWYNCWE